MTSMVSTNVISQLPADGKEIKEEVRVIKFYLIFLIKAKIIRFGLQRIA